MFKTTTLAACVIFAAPAVTYAQQSNYDATRPITRMAAPADLNDPNAIDLSSARGTASRVGNAQQATNVQPIAQTPSNAIATASQYPNQQSSSSTRTYVGYSAPTQTRVVAAPPAEQTTTQYVSPPRTIVYDNPRPIQTQPVPTQQVQRVQYPANYPTRTTYYAPPVQQAGTWHSVGETVQRVEYNSPVTYSAPVTTTSGTPVTVYRPTTTIAYNNPPVSGVPVVAPPVVASQPVVVPDATVYPIDRTTYRPVLPIVGLNNNSYVGRGLLGQPEVYTDGQPIRNALRYLFP